MTKEKILIIGGGIFGISTYITLKKNKINCTLIDKNSDILNGASTKNLNRIHFGYHYPRDLETAKQSLNGYKSFKLEYKNSIIKNFKNFYAIANNSKTPFKKYLQFCKKLNLLYKNINKENFYNTVNNIEGIIKVNEPIYDWNNIKKEIKKKISLFKKNSILLNEKVNSVKKEKNYFSVLTNKKTHHFNIIIDCSYEGSNKIASSLKKQTKYMYHLTCVYEFKIMNKIKYGLCLMDGNYFSFLPNGKKSSYLLYDVQYSILKKQISNKFNFKWKKNSLNQKIKINQKKIQKKIKKYFPDLKVKFLKKKYISPRVILSNVKKSDKRISFINQPVKNYYKVFSSKIDHSIDISKEILSKLKKL